MCDAPKGGAQVGRGKGHGEDRDRQQEGDFHKKISRSQFHPHFFCVEDYI